MSYVYPFLRDVYIFAPPDTRRRRATRSLSRQKRGGKGVLHARSSIIAMLCTTRVPVSLYAPVGFHRIRCRGPVQKMSYMSVSHDVIDSSPVILQSGSTVPQARHPPRFAFHFIYRSHLTLLHPTPRALPNHTTPHSCHPRHPTPPAPNATRATPSQPAPPHPRHPTTPQLTRRTSPKSTPPTPRARLSRSGAT